MKCCYDVNNVKNIRSKNNFARVKINLIMFVLRKHARKENMDKDATLLADTVKMRTIATIQTGLV